jgi:hypothetical protein
MACLHVSLLGGSRDKTWRGQGIRKRSVLEFCQNWVNCDGAAEVSDHVPDRTTYRQNNSWVVHEIPVEWLPVHFTAHRQPQYWNFTYHSQIVLSVVDTVWYVVWHLRCTITIVSVLANSKTHAFLFSVHTMFHNDCPLVVKPASTPRRLRHKKNFESISTYWYAPLRRHHPGFCTT